MAVMAVSLERNDDAMIGVARLGALVALIGLAAACASGGASPGADRHCDGAALAKRVIGCRRASDARSTGSRPRHHRSGPHRPMMLPITAVTHHVMRGVANSPGRVGERGRRAPAPVAAGQRG